VARQASALALGFAPILSLLGCGTFESWGQPARGFLTPAIARAYLPLEGTAYWVLTGRGAGMVIAPGVAVTNAHNANLVDGTDVIGTSSDYDLLFFRTARQVPPPQALPWAGEKVIAYGQGEDGTLRMARGVVRWTDAPVVPRCKGCGVQPAFAFEADAGPGFSGGPVVDAASGLIIGIVFGFRDDAPETHGRLMYAYDMRLVTAELSAVRHAAAVLGRRPRR
jgi:hypothetical protein